MALSDTERLILLVDDDDAHRDTVQEILERQGLVVVAAPGGAEALRLLTQHIAQVQQAARQASRLLLTDFQMPGMDGLELMRQAQSLLPELRVLMMSACAELAKRTAQERGIDAPRLVEKPIRRSELIEVITQILAGQ